MTRESVLEELNTEGSFIPLMILQKMQAAAMFAVLCANPQSLGRKIGDVGPSGGAGWCCQG